MAKPPADLASDGRASDARVSEVTVSKVDIGNAPAGKAGLSTASASELTIKRKELGCALVPHPRPLP